MTVPEKQRRRVVARTCHGRACPYHRASQKFNVLPLDINSLWFITLGISSHLEGALPGTLRNAGVGVAPAGGGQTLPHALGRPWVSVRPHYRGPATEVGWTGTGERREIAVLRLRPPSPRKNGPRLKDRHGGASEDVSVASVFLSRESCCGTNYLRRAFRRSTSLLIFEGG